MNFAELKSKEIIDIKKGKKIGFASDMVLDSKTNGVKYLSVSIQGKPFKKAQELLISFEDIRLIGEDVILYYPKEAIGNSLKVQEQKEEKKESEFYFSPKVFKKANKS